MPSAAVATNSDFLKSLVWRPLDCKDQDSKTIDKSMGDGQDRLCKVTSHSQNAVHAPSRLVPECQYRELRRSSV